MTNLNEVKFETIHDEQEEQFVEINGGAKKSSKLLDIMLKVWANKFVLTASDMVEHVVGR